MESTSDVTATLIAGAVVEAHQIAPGEFGQVLIAFIPATDRVLAWAYPSASVWNLHQLRSVQRTIDEARNGIRMETRLTGISEAAVFGTARINGLTF